MAATELDLCFDKAISLTKQVGQIIKEKALERNKYVESKRDAKDLVTKTDTEVEKLLFDSLAKQFPDHKFIGEESVAKGAKCVLTKDPTWIIDPIDGTMNFVHSFPHSCVSIALFVNETPEIGIIYNPTLEQLFTARRGMGAFLNGRPIRVSESKPMAQALVLVENFARKGSVKEQVILDNYKMLMRDTHGIRSLGSAALDMCMIACGAADAFYQYQLSIWDIAAGELIVTEAGGVVLDTNGGPLNRFANRILVANSNELAQALAQKLVQYDPTSNT